jgi:hypothetical protein
VFLETHTVLCHISLDYFVEFRSRLGGRESSQLNLPLVYEWIDLLPTEKPFVVFGKQDLKKRGKELGVAIFVGKHAIIRAQVSAFGEQYLE